MRKGATDNGVDCQTRAAGRWCSSNRSRGRTRTATRASASASMPEDRPVGQLRRASSRADRRDPGLGRRRRGRREARPPRRRPARRRGRPLCLGQARAARRGRALSGHFRSGWRTAQGWCGRWRAARSSPTTTSDPCPIPRRFGRAASWRRPPDGPRGCSRFVLECGMIGDESDRVPREARPGRGAASNRVGRFEPYARVAVDDGWDEQEEPGVLRTEVAIERPRSVITRNSSPDVPFDRSINPYRGCEHGCIYCFARPSHAFLGLSPGLDFETRLVARPSAPKVLAAELARRGTSRRRSRSAPTPTPISRSRRSSGSCAASSRPCATSATR